MMMILDSFEFPFSDEAQTRQFESAVRKYIAPQFQTDIKIEISNQDTTLIFRTLTTVASR